jgi:26S proteasome regulatory subunit N10
MARQHLSENTRAVVVLLDNTSTSMDGDFYPTRLKAQTLTVERFAHYLLTVEPLAQIAVGTLSSSEFGVRSSLTGSLKRIIDAVQTVTARAGCARLASGIRWAILALHHCPQDIRTKRILAFIGSDHDITTINAAELSEKMLAEKVYLDIVVFGPDVPRIPVLRRMIPKAFDQVCTFLTVEKSDTVLSDNVLASPIGPGQQMARIAASDLAKSDPELAQAISLSQAQNQPPIRQSSIEMLLLPGRDPPRGNTPKVRRSRPRPKAEAKDKTTDPSLKE